ncbi:hypothetical protein J3Q64DRAFT_1484646 [Phycomyces blakesleeanus]|uniref:Uncharacterized protein n=1 Tax=Phycomyces blakesleeanus TaxID=4837 RepID=A0ABR3B2N4_PHYBL
MSMATLLCMGEIKMNDNMNSLNQDLYRLTYFTKNTVDTFDFGMCLYFQAIYTVVHFYPMSLEHESAYVFTDIASVKIPTQRADIINTLLELDIIIRLAHLDNTLCKHVQNIIMYSPTIPCEMLEFKTKQYNPTKHNRSNFTETKFPGGERCFYLTRLINCDYLSGTQ